jgi:hypothetical protein
MKNLNKEDISQILFDSENQPHQFGELIWNGNEIVFEAYPSTGVAGIAPNMPDEFGKELCIAYNEYQLKKSIDEIEDNIRTLSDKNSDLMFERQILLGKFILDNKILAGTEWKFRAYGDIPRLSYNSAITKTDPLQFIIDLNKGDFYSTFQLSEGISLQLDYDKASIQFTEIKHIAPFCQKFELKVLPGNLITDLHKLIKQIKSLEIIYHAFNFTPLDEK